MSNLFNIFRSGVQSLSCAISGLFTFGIKAEEFVHDDIVTTYTKILTETSERTHGLNEKHQAVLFDSCVQGDASKGLISLLAEAMARQEDLFVVYLPSTDIIRKATREEEEQIRADYKVQAKSSKGVWISFKGYRRTKMLRIYSYFEYYVLASLNKSLNISKALQFKIKNLRASVSNLDAAVASNQGKELAKALGDGDDIMVDAEDEITTTTPDVSPAEKAIGFLDAKRSFYLDLPRSWVSGLQTPGIGSTGEADMRAVEAGLRGYFVAIIKPVFRAVFGVEKLEFKSLDFRNLNSAMDAMKTFGLTAGDGFVSVPSMSRIICRLLDLNYEEEKKALELEEKERAKEQDVLSGGTTPPGAPTLPAGKEEADR